MLDKLANLLLHAVGSIVAAAIFFGVFGPVALALRLTGEDRGET